MFGKGFLERLSREQRVNRDATDTYRKFEHGNEFDYGPGKRWGTYNSSAENYLEDFAGLIDRMEVEEIITSLHSSGRKVFGVDLMGQGGPCIELGCDSALAVTLDTLNQDANNALKKGMQVRGVDLQLADMFSPYTSKVLNKKVAEGLKEGKSLGLVFFRPVGGMEEFIRTSRLYSTLFLYYHYLVPLYNSLTENGIMLADFSFSADQTPSQSPRLFSDLRNWLEKKGLDIEFVRDNKTFLIKKTTASPQELHTGDFGGFVDEVSHLSSQTN